MFRRIAAPDGQNGVRACHRPDVIAPDRPVWRSLARLRSR